jgi:hypothetical protein
VKTKVFPDAFLSKIDPKDRKSVGEREGMTAKEAAQRYEANTEREEQKVFTGWLDLVRIPYVYARPDKKTTISVGWPDVTVLYRQQALLIEMKTPTGKLSYAQEETIAYLNESGTPVHVCRSALEAINLTKHWMVLLNQT